MKESEEKSKLLEAWNNEKKDGKKKDPISEDEGEKIKEKLDQLFKSGSKSKNTPLENEFFFFFLWMCIICIG
jgi:CRISPR/Cas system CMR subunit Cmr6 (Cas7 group RAMP superfamily)